MSENSNKIPTSLFNKSKIDSAYDKYKDKLSTFYKLQKNILNKYSDLPTKNPNSTHFFPLVDDNLNIYVNRVGMLSQVKSNNDNIENPCINNDRGTIPESIDYASCKSLTENYSMQPILNLNSYNHTTSTALELPNYDLNGKSLLKDTYVYCPVNDSLLVDEGAKLADDAIDTLESKGIGAIEDLAFSGAKTAVSKIKEDANTPAPDSDFLTQEECSGYKNRSNKKLLTDKEAFNNFLVNKITSTPTKCIGYHISKDGITIDIYSYSETSNSPNESESAVNNITIEKSSGVLYLFVRVNDKEDICINKLTKNNKQFIINKFLNLNCFNSNPGNPSCKGPTELNLLKTEWNTNTEAKIKDLNAKKYCYSSEIISNKNNSEENIWADKEGNLFYLNVDENNNFNQQYPNCGIWKDKRDDYNNHVTSVDQSTFDAIKNLDSTTTLHDDNGDPIICNPPASGKELEELNKVRDELNTAEENLVNELNISNSAEYTNSENLIKQKKIIDDLLVKIEEDRKRWKANIPLTKLAQLQSSDNLKNYYSNNYHMMSWGLVIIAVIAITIKNVT